MASVIHTRTRREYLSKYLGGLRPKGLLPKQTRPFGRVATSQIISHSDNWRTVTSDHQFSQTIINARILSYMLCTFLTVSDRRTHCFLSLSPSNTHSTQSDSAVHLSIYLSTGRNIMSTYIDQTFTNLKVLPFFSETNPDALEGFYVAGGEPPKTIWPEGLESVSNHFFSL